MTDSHVSGESVGKEPKKLADTLKEWSGKTATQYLDAEREALVRQAEGAKLSETTLRYRTDVARIDAERFVDGMVNPEKVTLAEYRRYVERAQEMAFEIRFGGRP